MELTKEKPFERQHLDSRNEGKIFTIRLNKEERAELDEAKKLLNQTKDSTACKQLMQLGYINVLHDKKIRAIIEHIINNKRKNERLGVADFD